MSLIVMTSCSSHGGLCLDSVSKQWHSLQIATQCYLEAPHSELKDGLSRSAVRFGFEVCGFLGQGTIRDFPDQHTLILSSYQVA